MAAQIATMTFPKYNAAKFVDMQERVADRKNLLTLGSIMGIAFGFLVNLPLIMH